MDVNRGIEIHGRTLMPREGMKAKKELVYDTSENRYVKWMIQRLEDKLIDLIHTIENHNKRWKIEPNRELIAILPR